MTYKAEYTYEASLINYIKRNKNKRDLFVVNVYSVSASGMSRQMKVGIVYKGQFVNITHLVAKATKNKLTDNNTIRVGGCGMDMCFHLLQLFGGHLLGKRFRTGKTSAFEYYKEF